MLCEAYPTVLMDIERYGIRAPAEHLEYWTMDVVLQEFLNSWQAPKRRGGNPPIAVTTTESVPESNTVPPGSGPERSHTQEGQTSDAESEPDLDDECVPADPDPVRSQMLSAFIT